MVFLIGMTLALVGMANVTAWAIWNSEHPPWMGIICLASGICLLLHEWIEQ